LVDVPAGHEMGDDDGAHDESVLTAAVRLFFWFCVGGCE
jgi:hypothetical protein